MNFHFDGPDTAPLTVVLAHGAGAPMDSPFMDAFAHGIAAAGFRVARFEFPYMAARRADGKKRPPNSGAVLAEFYREAVASIGQGARLVIGGKSLGGRVASLVADELGVRGLLCLGFPFHAPGRDPGSRIDHLQTLKTPTLILQGTRDPFGSRDDAATCQLSPAIAVHWLEDGNHDFKPRAASRRTGRQNWAEGIAAAVDFLSRVLRGAESAATGL